MKKLFTLSMLILIGISVYSQGSPRLVLWEQFTNTSCGPCASFNPSSEAYWSENEDILIPIAFHVWWPGANDPMYVNNTAEQQWRTNMYGCNSVPWTTINGNKYNAVPNLNSIISIVEAEAEVLSPFEINLSHEKSADETSVTVTMEITCTQDITSDMIGYIAIIEKRIEFANPPGNNGEKVFHNVFKKFLPDNNGTALPGSMSIGDSFTIEEEWEITGFYDEIMLGAIGFVQNTSDKYIQQAAYSAPVGPDFVDAYVKEVMNPQEVSCGNPISPIIKVQNSGGIELTSFDVEYNINGGDVSTFAWTGNIPFLSSATIDLPEISGDLTETSNIIDFTITNPNGGDDANPNDNTISKTFDSPETGVTVTMTSLLGTYAEELSWKLYDPNGSIVAEDSYNASNNGQTVEETFTLAETGCYNLVWFDSYGDGFNGGGWCRLYEDDVEFVYLNSFTSEIGIPWYAITGDILEAPINPTATLVDYTIDFEWTAPGKATLLGYNIYNGTDMNTPINSEIIEETNYEYTLDNNGQYEFYFTAVYEEGESEAVGPVEVSITVGISSLSSNSLSFYPNPVQNSLFVEFELENNSTVSGTIYSISGAEIFQIEEEVKSAGNQKVNINTNSLENGLYFLQLDFNNEKTIIKFNVVK